MENLNIQPTSCCLGDRGNVNGSPNDEFDISDLVYLVNYMFKEGSEPVCMEEANINGSIDEQFDISDITYLTRYMFKDGPPPATCP